MVQTESEELTTPSSGLNAQKPSTKRPYKKRAVLQAIHKGVKRRKQSKKQT
jgi:hypothetical protein